MLPDASVPVTEPTRPALWIRTVAGPSIGFGHLRRSLVLARILEASLEPIFLLDPGDSGSQAQVAAQGWRTQLYRGNTVWSKLPLPDAILIDTRETQGTLQLLAEAHARGIPIISIHDLGLNPLPSEIVIDGSILPMTDQFSGRNTSFYTGPEYLVLDPAFGLMHQRHKRIADRIEAVVVNLGGGNSGPCFVKVLEGLRLCDLELEVTGLPGFTSWGQSSIAETDWRPLRFRWAKDDESLARLLFHADLAITAGGLSAYEALCTGTPLLAVAVEKYQSLTISALEVEEACINLGCLDSFNPVRIPGVLCSLATDGTRRARLSLRGARIVDGCGAERVSHLIREAVFDHAGIAPAGNDR